MIKLRQNLENSTDVESISKVTSCVDVVELFPENLSELDLERVKELLAVEAIRKELAG